MTPPILASAADLLQAYDVLFCDVWGVVHNGQRAYAEAGEALARFRAGGGTVILVSNAPVPAAGVEQVVGFDPRLHTLAEIERLGVEVIAVAAAVETGLIDTISIASSRMR